jgi:hypothetical protein
MKSYQVMKMTRRKSERDEESKSDEDEQSQSEEEDNNRKKATKANQPRLRRELRALGITQESDEISRYKTTRELRSQGTTQPAEESTTTTTSSNKEEAPGVIHSAITSDPGVPTTFEEVFFGPMSHVWRPAIYEELMSFINRKAFKKRDKKSIDIT